MTTNKCPKCGSFLDQGVPADIPHHRRCANCKNVWRPGVDSDAFEPRVSRPPEPVTANGHRLEEWGPEDIRLPNFQGDPAETESVAVYVKQGSVNEPHGSIEFITGNGWFSIMDWGPKELRQLASFLNDCADRLDYYTDHKV